MVDATRLREELRRMRALIQEDPTVKAQFDKDGNGVIDGEEWEEVRQLVTKRLEREQEETEERTRLEEEMREAGESTGTDTPADLAAAGAVAQGIIDEDLQAPGAHHVNVLLSCESSVISAGLLYLLRTLAARWPNLWPRPHPRRPSLPVWFGCSASSADT